MSLALNTRSLLDRAAGKTSLQPSKVEYHLLAWRELYDKSIITADRYSSDAAQWVVRGGEHSYTVTVVSRPYYRLPQELCLSFDCFIRDQVSPPGRASPSRHSWLPYEQVALEFSVLLSVFAREPLVLAGLRRTADRPIVVEPHRVSPSSTDRASTPPPYGIDSPEFIALLSGFANAPDDLVEAVLGAAKLYYAGLSLSRFDPSVAYVSFVSSIECLAGYHFKDHTFDFDAVPRFAHIKPILESLALGDAAAAGRVEELKAQLIRSEHFLRQKFVLFLEDHVGQGFWETPDELYPDNAALPGIPRDSFSPVLRDIYDARSRYLHGGAPYADYVEFGLRERLPASVLPQLFELRGKQHYIPSIPWFERLVHTAIAQFMRRSLAPDLAEADSAPARQAEDMLHIISGLPPNVQESLRRLVESTARFLGYALINPHVPNAEWADAPETVQILKNEGIIDGEGHGLDGSSWRSQTARPAR